MSDAAVDLDRLVEQAWREFREAFADALEALARGGCLQVAVPATDDPYVAAPYVRAHHVGDAILLEVSGNTFLSPGYKLSRKGQRDLRGLGLRRPSKDAPNYEASYPLGHVDQAASVAVSAFRTAFGVVHPAFLVSDRVVWQADSPLPTAEAASAPAGAVVAYPVSREHLDRLIDEALTPVFGHAPCRDSDGDIPVRSGSAVVFVSNLWPAPCVRLFAELVVDVDRPIRAVHELGVLNHDVDGVKFALHGQTITASLDVATTPFAAEHLQISLEQLCDVASRCDAELARRVSGRVFLDASQPRPSDEDDDGGGEDEYDGDEEADDEDAVHPVMLSMLQLDADRPGSVGPATAARLCDYDSDLILELIRWNEGQEIAWRQARDEAQATDEDDEAEACEIERAHASRTISVLRKALRRVLLG